MTSSHAMNRFESDNFSSADIARNQRLEGFFWKLLMISMLVYLVWDEHFFIQLGPLSIGSGGVERPVKQETNWLDILKSTTERPKSSLQDCENSVVPGILNQGDSKADDTADSVMEANLARCKHFVKQFSPVAIAEMRQFNIPASVLLAEALLASHAGTDAHLSKTNNYFNIRDNSGQLEKFPLIWGSFRARSHELSSNQGCRKLCAGGRAGYRDWAKQLGFMMKNEHPDYAAKIMTIVERLNLEYFDRNF